MKRIIPDMKTFSPGERAAATELINYGVYDFDLRSKQLLRSLGTIIDGRDEKIEELKRLLREAGGILRDIDTFCYAKLIAAIEQALEPQ